MTITANIPPSVPFPWPEEAGVYNWKPRTNLGVDVNIVVKRMQELGRCQDGGISPQAIVEDSRRKDSPFRALMEHDKATAADQYRLSQAYYILRSITWTPTTVVGGHIEYGEPVRAFVIQRDRLALPVPVETEEEAEYRTEREKHIYVPIQRAMADTEYRQFTEKQALTELGWWQRKYRQVKELAEVFAAIEPFLPKAP